MMLLTSVSLFAQKKEVDTDAKCISLMKVPLEGPDSVFIPALEEVGFVQQHPEDQEPDTYYWEPDETYSAPDYDEIKKPTMFDGLDNDWEHTLSQLCYMSSHMEEYQQNLNTMLSDVDKEVCDLLHYLEFNDLSDAEMLKTSKMLQERRRRRREIKDEMERTAVMRSTFLDDEFSIKVHQGLEQIEHMKARIYTPRRLSELFNEQMQKAV